MNHSRLCGALVAFSLCAAFAASAGPIFLTGHDPDFHAQDDAGAQRLLGAGVTFVRHGSSLPLLWVESRISVPGGHRVGKAGLTAIGMVEGTSFIHLDGGQLAALTAADWSALKTTYSAIGVASDFGGILTQAELDQLIAHKDSITDFVNAGGGVMALSECNTGSAPCLTSGGAFSFLPITIASTGNASPPYTVSAYGFSTFGLLDSDVNSPSHSHFDDAFGLNVVSSSVPTGQIMTLAGEVHITPQGFLVANAGPDQTLDGGPSTPVTLDGSGSSSDPGGAPLHYDWAEGATPLASTSSATTTVLLPPGTHSITLTVTNTRGETATDTVVIVIHNTAPPQITCPASIVTTTEPGVCAAHVSYPAPTATSGPGIASLGCNHASGSVFLGGVTPVTCTATDTNGNSAQCQFLVQVNDNEPPHVTAPAASTVSANNSCGASVPDAVAASTFTDNCTPADELIKSQSPAAGTAVGLGTTAISVSATDESGNTATAGTSLTVADTTPPVISSLTATPSLCQAKGKWVPVAITAAATDACTHPPACKIVWVTNNERPSCHHDRDDDLDWVVTGALTLKVRAEREGHERGVVYTIGVQCTDAAGNASAIRAVTVTVGKDKDKDKDHDDDHDGKGDRR